MKSRSLRILYYMLANKICFVFPDGLTNYFDLADVMIVTFLYADTAELLHLAVDFCFLPECLVITEPSSQHQLFQE